MMRGELRDGRGNFLAEVEVQQVESGYEGRVLRLSKVVDDVGLFARFEKAVNDQLFTELDRIEDEILALDITLVRPSYHPLSVTDLQVFPMDKVLSFKATPTSGG